MPPVNSAPTESGLSETAARLIAAEQAGDIPTLGIILGADYHGYDPSGRPQDRETVLESYRRGNVRFDLLTVSDLALRVLGDVGLVAGVSRLRGHTDGEHFDLRLRFLDVYAWRDGRWELVASQDTRLPW
jgi:ketosteroid isomerase-like protein